MVLRAPLQNSSPSPSCHYKNNQLTGAKQINANNTQSPSSCFSSLPPPPKKKKVALAWGLLWVLTAYQLFQHVLYPTLTIQGQKQLKLSKQYGSLSLYFSTVFLNPAFLTYNTGYSISFFYDFKHLQKGIQSPSCNQKVFLFPPSFTT